MYGTLQHINMHCLTQGVGVGGVTAGVGGGWPTMKNAPLSEHN